MKGNDYFRQLLGIKVHETKDGYAKLSLKLAKEHMNAVGFTHGGVVFALADCAFAEAVNFGDKHAVAVQVSINFLRPSTEGDVLVAEATTVSDGKTLALCSVVVKKDDKDVAMFSGLAYKIVADK
ncbi:MAG: PaaI family thioesterase [Candidatus Bathyarchaeia archaeon]|jgi:acyl-CoA thioesterase